MQSFNIFYFKEHDSDNIDEIDHQIFVLYDESDGYFYYYGTRDRDNQGKFNNYSGRFHYTRLNDLVQMIDILVDGFNSPLTTEIHQIELVDYEYNTLNFKNLKKKISVKTELAAYDSNIESYDNIYNYLQTLITHEI